MTYGYWHDFSQLKLRTRAALSLQNICCAALSLKGAFSFHALKTICLPWSRDLHMPPLVYCSASCSAALRAVACAAWSAPGCLEQSSNAISVAWLAHSCPEHCSVMSNF